MSVKLANLIREMIEEELEEAGAIGDGQTLGMMQGVLSQIIAKHGGDYTKASQSPEWQTAIANGNQALAASTAPSIVKPMQTTGPIQKKSLADLRPSNQQATLAQKQQQAATQTQQRNADVAMKLRQKQQKGTMEAVQLTSGDLVETIRVLVKEALEGSR